jgi:hypothetical protein
MTAPAERSPITTPRFCSWTVRAKISADELEALSISTINRPVNAASSRPLVVIGSRPPRRASRGDVRGEHVGDHSVQRGNESAGIAAEIEISVPCFFATPKS